MRVARLESVSDGLRAAQDCLGATMPAGSPERVLVAARRAAAFADELRSVAAELTAAVDTPIWRGVAHAAFLDHVHVRLPAFGDTAARYDGYAAVLSGYAAELRTAMDELPWLRRELVLRVQALGERAVAPSGRPDAVAEVEHRQLLPYARRFVQVHSRWADAVDRCSAGLSLVDRRDPSRDRHGWRLVAHRLDNVARSGRLPGRTSFAEDALADGEPVEYRTDRGRPCAAVRVPAGRGCRARCSHCDVCRPAAGRCCAEG